MKNTVLHTLLFLIICCLSATAQHRRCATEALQQPTYAPSGQDFEQQIAQKIAEKLNNEKLGRIQREDLNFPIIVHVLHLGEPVGEGTNISAAQIYSQFEVLEEDFNLKNANSVTTVAKFKPLAASVGFHFKPATISPSGTPLLEKGINRISYPRNKFSIAELNNTIKPATIWDPKRYINVWVCDMNGTGFVGFAQFPYAPSINGLDTDEKESSDGIVVDYRNFGSIDKVRTPQLLEGDSLNLGRTLTHELGHFFGLIHIWGDVINCETTTDYCADTPPQRKPNYGCELDNRSCTELDMAQNFLDYTRDRCMTLFTVDQANRMRAVVDIAKRRKELTTSNAANPIEKGIFANFTPNRKLLCVGQTVSFTNKSLAFGSSSIASYAWTFEGGTPSTSSEPNPTVRYNSVGQFAVKLVVSGGTESNTINFDNFITVTGTTGATTSLLKDYQDSDPQSGGWFVSDNSWRITKLGSGTSERLVIHADNYSQDLQGRRCEIVSPSIDVRGVDFLDLSFDYAYSTRERQYDSLLILYSTDCGGTYQAVFRHGGWDLSTAITRNTLFRATNANDWQKVKLSIPLQSQAEYLKVMFVNVSARGNALYLDNILLQPATHASKPSSADFVADYQTLVPGDVARFRISNLDFTEYSWNLASADIVKTDFFLTKAQYKSAGSFNAELSLSNSKGNQTEQKTAYIKVLDAQRSKNAASAAQNLRQTSSGFLAGTSNRGEQAKAEKFKLVSLNTLYGMDFRFAHVSTSDPSRQVKLKIWIADNTTGEPARELISKVVSYGDIIEFSKRGLPYRWIFESPLDITQAFFAGFELDKDNSHQLALFSSEVPEGENHAWELTSANVWQPFSKNAGQGGREVDVSLAIAAITNRGVVNGDQIRYIDHSAVLYPNPAEEWVFLKDSDEQVQQWQVLSQTGRSLLSGTEWPLNVSQLHSGIYWLKLQTQKGFFVRKLCIMR